MIGRNGTNAANYSFNNQNSDDSSDLQTDLGSVQVIFVYFVRLTFCEGLEKLWLHFGLGIVGGNHIFKWCVVCEWRNSQRVGYRLRSQFTGIRLLSRLIRTFRDKVKSLFARASTISQHRACHSTHFCICSCFFLLHHVFYYVHCYVHIRSVDFPAFIRCRHRSLS